MTRPAAAPTPALAQAARIADANVDDIGLDVFVIHDSEQATPVAHRIRLGPDAGAEIILAARDYMQRVTDRTMLAYAPALLVPGGHSLYLDQTRAVNLTATESAMAAGKVDNYDASADYARQLRLIAFRFTTNDGAAVTLFRVLKPMFRLGRSRLVALLQQDGQYNRLDPQNLLLFDLEFDVLVAAGTAIFDKKATFERAFGFYDELVRNSRRTFSRVTKDLRIKGVAQLEAACTSETTMMNKMASIARSLDEDPAYAKAMTMPKLIAFLNANPHLGIDVYGRGASAQLVFDNTPQKRFKILNLLDDDFLRSELTQREYEANSKTRPVAQ